MAVVRSRAFVTRRGIILVIVGSVSILLVGLAAAISADAALRSDTSLVLPETPPPGFELSRSFSDLPAHWPFNRKAVRFTTEDLEWLDVNLYEAPSALLALLFGYVVLPPEPDMPNYELGVAVDELEGIGFGRRDAIQCGSGENDACQGWVYWSFSGDQILTVVLWGVDAPGHRAPEVEADDFREIVDELLNG